MKEMLGNYVDGQIEFYKAVRRFLFPYVCRPFLNSSPFLIGYGRVGADHTYYSTHTSGRLIFGLGL